MAIFYPSLVEIRSDMMEHHTAEAELALLGRTSKTFQYDFQVYFQPHINIASTPMQLFFTRQVER